MSFITGSNDIPRHFIVLRYLFLATSSRFFDSQQVNNRRTFWVLVNIHLREIFLATKKKENIAQTIGNRARFHGALCGCGFPFANICSSFNHNRSRYWRFQPVLGKRFISGRKYQIQAKPQLNFGKLGQRSSFEGSVLGNIDERSLTSTVYRSQFDEICLSVHFKL